MPIDYKDYPPNWKQIRADILLRAGNCCEKCKVPNRVWITRGTTISGKAAYQLPNGFFYDAETGGGLSEDESEFKNEPDKMIQVVLTIAHLDHQKANADYDNLRAWCQRCHIRYDASSKAIKAKITRAQNKLKQISKQGQTNLLDLLEDGA